MSFDISKTETFLPAFWIFAKYLYVSFFVSLAVDCTKKCADIRESVYPFNYHFVFILLIFTAISETLYDAEVLRKSNVINKVLVENGKDLKISNIYDMCMIYLLFLYPCIMHVSKGIHNVNYINNILFFWCMLGTTSMCVEILIKSSHFKRFAKYNTSHILRYLLNIMTAITITSESLGAICMDFTGNDLLLRFFFYTTLVLLRCYTQVLYSETFNEKTHNICLFAWTIVVPAAALYCCLVCVSVSYVALYIDNMSVLRTPTTETTLDQVVVDNKQIFPKTNIYPQKKEIVVDDQFMLKLNETVHTQRRKPPTLF